MATVLNISQIQSNFRKDGNLGEKGITKRVGLALGEGEKGDSEPLEQDKLLRRVGVGAGQDQEAVESVKKEGYV